MSLGKRIRDFIFCYLPLPDYYGRDFKRILGFLHDSSSWSRAQLEQFKLKRIRSLLDHAERNVPYYRRLFKELDLHSRDINSLADFAQLPTLSREELEQNLDELKADNFASYRPIPTITSGTSGRAAKLFRSRFQEKFRNAAFWRALIQNGYWFRDRKVTVADPSSYDPNSPLAELNRLENDLVINTYHVIAGKLDPFPDIIRGAQPKMIWAHPNILYCIARYMIEHEIPPIEVPLVAIYAEKIWPHVGEALRQAFPGKYIEYYANRENTVAAWGDADGFFREVSEYCHLEVESSGDESSVGEVVSTSLHNYALPLIRYKPDDTIRHLGYLGQDRYPTFELLGGRGKDLLQTRDGFVVPYVLLHLDHVGFHKLREYQLEQVTLDDVIIHIVPTDDYYPETDEARLLKHTDEALAGRFRLKVDVCQEIPFTQRGKRPQVISRLTRGD